MNIPEIVKIADDLIFSHTGQHLDYLQEAIIKGTLEYKNYTKIAEEINCSESHLKNTGAELWQVLSDALGEHITKNNFRHILNKALFFSGKDYATVNNNINLCSERDSTKVQQQTEIEREDDIVKTPQNNESKQPISDLSYAPEILNFSGHSSELSIFKQWILDNNIRLITLYGLSEIGKSTFISYLITQIKDNFDYIIWRNLSEVHHFDKLTYDLRQYFGKFQQQTFPKILDYFINYRCLLILDDFQNLFKTNELAGEFLPEYQDYSKFFQEVVTLSHQSCLIIISWEKPRHLSSLERNNHHLKTFHLKGFAGNNTEILQENDLQDEDKWSELIELYQGHPSWLNIIVEIINDLFNGSVANFLNYNQELFLGDIELILERHLSRLSLSEKKVIYWLANNDNYLDIFTISSKLELSNIEFLKIVQSLERRCLIEKVTNNGDKVFQLNSVFKQFLKGFININ